MRNQALRQFTIMLSMLALFGFGCKGSAPVASVQDAPPAPDARVADAPVSDAGPKIPEGWKVYENKAWAVSVAYPGAWHYRERTTEETGNQNELWVDFNKEPIVPLPESDPVYPISLVVTTSTLDESLNEYQTPDAIDLVKENVTIGDKLLVKVSYVADLISMPVVAYLYESDGRVYDISGLESLPELNVVVASLTVGR